MKFFVFICLLGASFNGFSQANNYKCPCPEIGIDSLWAETNQISCYLIPVDRDISNPSAGKYNLAVLTAPGINSTMELPLLYLHGGPGIATLENVPKYLKSKTWELIRKDRPLVFFDYRGTGFSQPTLCPGISDSLALAQRKNLSGEEMHAYKTQLFKKCRTQHQLEGIEISTFSSFQLAQDAESIRKMLQIDKWNVYGVSHGTTVALNLLRNHEKNINSVILDSPFPPNAPWPDFVRPFATSFQVLESKIAEDIALKSIFPSVKEDFVAAVTRLNKQPYQIKIDENGGTYAFTGDDFAWSIWNGLLKPTTIKFVPLVIKEVANGNESVILEWVPSIRDPNGFGKFSEYQSKAILCYEGKPKLEADTKASLLSQFPDFNSFNIDFEDELCAVLQPKSAGRETFEPVNSNVPVLILSGEYDPVCPPLFGEITSQTLTNSTFINVPAASHAAIHIDECVRNIAANFLSKTAEKVSWSCVSERPKIKFFTGNLKQALSDINKNKQLPY